MDSALGNHLRIFLFLHKFLSQNGNSKQSVCSRRRKYAGFGK